MATLLEAGERRLVEHDQAAFNRAVWRRILADPELRQLPYRIESDQHGQIIISPPPAPGHGLRQAMIAHQLSTLLPEGKTITECPVSTGRGVKAVDVAWCSAERWARCDPDSCLSMAPEICVEVLSPGNARSEIEEKRRLYFASGAHEVWLCDEAGTIQFFLASAPERRATASGLCPGFAGQIQW